MDKNPLFRGKTENPQCWGFVPPFSRGKIGNEKMKMKKKKHKRSRFCFFLESLCYTSTVIGRERLIGNHLGYKKHANAHWSLDCREGIYPSIASCA